MTDHQGGRRAGFKQELVLDDQAAFRYPDLPWESRQRRDTADQHSNASAGRRPVDPNHQGEATLIARQDRGMERQQCQAWVRLDRIGGLSPDIPLKH